MTDLTTADLALPQSLRRAGRSSPTSPAKATAEVEGRSGIVPGVARVLLWFWLQWRRHEIVRVLRRVDARLLRDAGIEPCDVEEIVDTLVARWR